MLEFVDEAAIVDIPEIDTTCRTHPRGSFGDIESAMPRSRAK